MAERWYVLGDLQKAIVFQERAAQLLPKRMETQLNLALYWSERAVSDDLKQAELTLRSLVVQFPDRPILLFNWASLLDQTGNQQEARRVYRRTLELDPDFEPARQNLRAYESQ